MSIKFCIILQPFGMLLLICCEVWISASDPSILPETSKVIVAVAVAVTVARSLSLSRLEFTNPFPNRPA